MSPKASSATECSLAPWQLATTMPCRVALCDVDVVEADAARADHLEPVRVGEDACRDRLESHDQAVDVTDQLAQLLLVDRIANLLLDETATALFEKTRDLLARREILPRQNQNILPHRRLLFPSAHRTALPSAHPRHSTRNDSI
jgi:hypothetical protein